MNADREAGLNRLSGYQVNDRHPYYLHLRCLFADLEKAAVRAKGRLLDIGCGNKPYKEMFTGRISEYVGCDVVQSSEQRVDVICPANAIPLPDASFDTVLCTQVIEHVADHQGLLRESFRLLRPGGVLILSGPMYWPLHEEPFDFFRFTEHGLRHLLEDTGYAVEQIQPSGGKWALCGQTLIHTFKDTRLGGPFWTRIINSVFARLEDRRTVYTNPMNYVVVAGKP